MAYLGKSERKQQIIDSAKKFVLSEGLNALTVRRLAEQAEFSVGQVHHHFDSIHDLKAQVFLELVHENLNLNGLADNVTTKDKLIYLLGSEATTSETPYVRVWNDAESNMYRHSDFKKVYTQAIKIWQQKVIDVLYEGLENSEFNFRLDQINEISFRLISLAIGLEYLSNLEIADLQHDFFHRQILFIIQHELST